MSTDYRIKLISSLFKTHLNITDNLNPLPGSDHWSAEDETEWGIANGTVGNWGTKDLFLQGSGIAPIAVLNGFTKDVKVGESGTGEKNFDEGTFPSGEFRWECVSID
jgi:hypothetical protein